MPPPDEPALPTDMDGRLSLVLGQMLESTRVTAQGFRELTTEVREIASTLVNVNASVSAVEDGLSKIEQIISGNTTGLVAISAEHAAKIDHLNEACQQLRQGVTALRGQLSRLDARRASSRGARTMFWHAVQLAGWIATIAVAGIAAWANWKQITP